MTAEPDAGWCVGLVFADDEGGDPAEVVGRVMAKHADIISMLPGDHGEAVWQDSVTYQVSWEPDR